MRKARSVDDVARGIYAANGGLQMPIDDYSFLRVRNAGLSQSQALGARLAAGCDEQMRAAEFATSAPYLYGKLDEIAIV
jgi:hypothetical protein